MRRSFTRFAYSTIAVVLGSFVLLGCETSAEEAGRTDFFTFLLFEGDSDALEGYFYAPVDHTYSHQEECGLFGWDFEGTAAKLDGTGRPIDDTAVQGPDTYIQYWATPDGSLCPPDQFADAQFEYNGVRYVLDGQVNRSFADLSVITIPPDATQDFYASGDWYRDGGPFSEELNYWQMWPYEYVPEGESTVTCDGVFGDAEGYVLCEQAGNTCKFYVVLNDSSCADLCSTYMKTCVTAFQDNDGCEETGPGSCDDVVGDRICVCAK